MIRTKKKKEWKKIKSRRGKEKNEIEKNRE